MHVHNWHYTLSFDNLQVFKMNFIDAQIIIFGIVLLILFFLLKSTQVPKQVYKSKAIYSDHKERLEKALFSKKYNLKGKPDFILHTKDGLLPLEIKSTPRPEQPYFSHVMQLISYCLLMEEERNIRSKYGFIQYKGGQPFYIPYTEKMKAYLIKIMDEMRYYLDSGIQPVANRRYKCEKCSYKEDCFED